MKDEAGAAFTITLPHCIAAFGFLVAERSRFLSPFASVKWTYPSP
jgi:hypothetical protein